MFIRANPLPGASSDWAIYPARALRVTSIMLLVNACLLVGLCAFSSVVSIVWAALNMALCITLVVAAFIPPNKILHLVLGLVSVLLWVYGWAAFAFYIISILERRGDYIVLNIVSATFCGAGEIVSLVWIIYALRWYHHVKDIASPEDGNQVQLFNDFPRKALIILSVLSHLAGLGVLVAPWFTPFLFVRPYFCKKDRYEHLSIEHTPLQPMVYAPISFVLSINLIIASAIRPNLFYVFVSAVLILCVSGWSLVNLVFSIVGASYWNIAAPIISEADFTFIQGGLFISWGSIALMWFHKNRPQRSPQFPVLVLKTLSITCLIFLSSFIIGSAVVLDLYVRIFPSVFELDSSSQRCFPPRRQLFMLPSPSSLPST
jgi:hypothetical protein